MRYSTIQPHVSEPMLCLVLWLGLWLCGFCGYSQSNVPIGQWQVHVPYRQAFAVADAGDKIYVAAANGLFYYDKEFNATETLSKVDGLSEQQISAIGYDSETSTLVIAYANAKVDLLRNGHITSLNDIFRKSMVGEKRINAMAVYNGLAYLSCSFGVVVLDLQKNETRDTYSNLGPQGEAVNVKAVAVLHDSLYAATNFGVLGAPTSGANLQDFKSWAAVSSGRPAAETLTGLTAFAGMLYAGTSAGGLYVRSGHAWHSAVVPPGAAVNSLTSSAAYLSVATPQKIYVVDKQQQVTVKADPLLQSAQQALVGDAGVLWVADNTKGLVRLSLTNTDAAAFAPNGPYSGNSFSLTAQGGKVYSATGGYSESYLDRGLRDGFAVYENNSWQSYNNILYPNANANIGARDIVKVVFNPATQKLYVASYGSGLIEWNSVSDTRVYNGTNSPLLSALSASERLDYIRITDVEVDAEGNVWVVNRNQIGNAPGLHVLKPDGTWQSFTLPGVADGSNLDQLLIDDNGYKWLSIARRNNTRSGIVVFDEQENRVRYLSAGEGSGNLPDGAVYSMAKDLNGDVWVGTANGVGVYYSPAYVFEEQVYDARVPIVERRPLLDGQTVRAIAVDGANRKWMGTKSGLWLFNPEGDELLRHFTSQNSPLPSSNVLSIAVESQSGEVFVATDAGVASYRAEATVTEGTPACAMVFPNPVQKSYTGMVGISGLPNNADVRITDISGALVFKGRATGGTFAWDTRDYNGKRVKAGVYLVMSASQDGSEACISKIAVL